MKATQTNKFSLFTAQELTELIRTFQASARNNKTSRALFDQLDAEWESKFPDRGDPAPDDDLKKAMARTLEQHHEQVLKYVEVQ